MDVYRSCQVLLSRMRAFCFCGLVEIVLKLSLVSLQMEEISMCFPKISSFVTNAHILVSLYMKALSVSNLIC